MLEMNHDEAARDDYADSHRSLYNRCILGEPGAMAQREAFIREKPEGELLEAPQ